MSNSDIEVLKATPDYAEVRALTTVFIFRRDGKGKKEYSGRRSLYRGIRARGVPKPIYKRAREMAFAAMDKSMDKVVQGLHQRQLQLF